MSAPVNHAPVNDAHVDETQDIQLLFFGGLRALVGHDAITHRLGAARTVGQLLDELAEPFPPVGIYRAALRVAVNADYAQPDDPVKPGDEVALIPPVAGG